MIVTDEMVEAALKGYMALRHGTTREALRAALTAALAHKSAPEIAPPSTVMATGAPNSNDDWYARSDAEIAPPSDVQKAR